ncbi:MAG: NAD(+)/NADH kinase [Planctomycetaceae bacterium]|nr:NAD(+)/NADH kinase [Planctomycetaceae bacterium]
MAPGDVLRLIVAARDQSPRVQNAWNELKDFLQSQPQTEIVAAQVTRDLELDGLAADLVVVLGGDGAILRACHQLGRRQLPILGINLGRLGFLADLSPEEFRESFPSIQAGEYRIAEHLMFECRLIRADGSETSWLGLNEVALTAGASFRMIDVELQIDDEPVTTYGCDGLIVSTPVGSTAHSLSAGGPILRQDLSAFVITPICPHTLTNRPLIDDADGVYTLRVPNAPEGVLVVIDGQMREPIFEGDRIEIRRAPVTFKLARVPHHSYYATLHKKLGWGGQPRYRRQ